MTERRALIALVDPVAAPRPVRPAPHDHLVRTAAVLGGTGRAEVVIWPWYGVSLDERGAQLGGAGSVLRNERVVPVEPPARRPDMLLAFPCAGMTRPGRADVARRALESWRSAGVDVSSEDCVTTAVCRMLYEASRRGVVTNAPGFDGVFEGKDTCEAVLQAYRRATGRVVARPETYVLPLGQVPLALRAFAARSRACILKPSGGARGEGIVVIRPGETAPNAWPPDTTMVVQELVTDPLLVRGRKADVRCYVAVDTARPSGFRHASFLRTAGIEHAPGWTPAEVTNCAYRARRRLVGEMLPLEEAPALRRTRRAAIERGIERVLGELLRVRRWHAEQVAAEEPRRLQVWGVDLAVSMARDDVSVTLLEVNVQPSIFGSWRSCDSLLERFLAETFTPRPRARKSARR